MTYSNYWSKTNYLAPIPYVVNSYITEYDISKANINILYYYGVINDEMYNMLYNCDKMQREVYVGKMERSHPEISDIKANGIKEFRHKFFSANNIQDSELLSIKNDAIYVIGKKCQFTKFDNVEFRESNVYTTYMRLPRLELYYSFDPITNNEVLDIKGIKDAALELHREYMVSFLCDVCYKLQNSSVEEAIKTNNELLEAILTRQIDVRFFREFNGESMYRMSSRFSTFFINNAVQSDIDYLDPACNIEILRCISSILSDIYLSKFNKNKR